MGAKPLSTYGHFTAMQVRGRGVRGLDRHFRRLDDANRELFETPVDPEEVRRALRDALGDATDASARVYVIDGVLSAWAGPPNSPPATAQRLASVPYVRPFAHLKHLGGFGQSHHARIAERAGFDDVLLTGADGTVSETLDRQHRLLRPGRRRRVAGAAVAARHRDAADRGRHAHADGDA